MSKELIFAIIAGTLFGVAIAFGVWRVNASLSSTTTKSIVKASVRPTSTPLNTDILINSPGENEIISTPVLISGLSTPGAIIIVSNGQSDYLVEAGSSGEFKTEVDADAGVNQIIFTKFDQDGKKSEKKLTVVYSSEFEKQNAPQATTTSASDAAERKIQIAKNPPLAYMGTVTDISDTTIEIESIQGEIQQISVDQDKTTYAKVDKVSKIVGFKDIAIGDFVVGMGYKNGNQVLHTKRILITAEPKMPDLKVIKGTVTSVDKKTVSIADQQKSNIGLTIDKSSKAVIYKSGTLKIMNVADIDIGQNVYATVTNNNIIRRIFVISDSSAQ